MLSVATARLVCVLPCSYALPPPTPRLHQPPAINRRLKILSRQEERALTQLVHQGVTITALRARLALQRLEAESEAAGAAAGDDDGKVAQARAGLVSALSSLASLGGGLQAAGELNMGPQPGEAPAKVRKLRRQRFEESALAAEAAAERQLRAVSLEEVAAQLGVTGRAVAEKLVVQQEALQLLLAHNRGCVQGKAWGAGTHLGGRFRTPALTLAARCFCNPDQPMYAALSLSHPRTQPRAHAPASTSLPSH